MLMRSADKYASAEEAAARTLRCPVQQVRLHQETIGKAFQQVVSLHADTADEVVKVLADAVVAANPGRRGAPSARSLGDAADKSTPAVVSIACVAFGVALLHAALNYCKTGQKQWLAAISGWATTIM